MTKKFGPFCLDEVNNCLWNGTREVPLAPTPFDLLSYLVRNAGRLVSQAEALEKVWPGVFVGPDVLKTHIHTIRQALGDSAHSPHFIETRSRRGYRFIAPVTETAEAPAPPHRAAPAPFCIGRSDALRAIEQALGRADAGLGNVVFITGEAGIGKTALLGAVRQHAAARGNTVMLLGQCNPPIGALEEFHPLLDVFAGLWRLLDDPQARDAVRGCAPGWCAQLPELGTAPRDQASTQGMGREFCAAVEILSRDRTLVLAIEDCQWVDRRTLAAISMLVRRPHPCRVVVLLTQRPDSASDGAAVMQQLKLDLQTRRLGTECALQRLTEGGVAELLQAGTQGALPEELRRLVWRYSEGNPLMAQATLEHLLAQGQVQRDATGWRVRAPLAASRVGIPVLFEQMLDLELARLEPQSRALLVAGSIAGTGFCTFSLSALLDIDRIEAERACFRIAGQGRLIRPDGFALLGDGSMAQRFAFDYALYRDILHRRQPAMWRAMQHRRLGECAEHALGERHGYYARALAYRFSQCEDWPRVLRYLHLALEDAEQRQAGEEVAELRHRIAAVPRAAANPFEPRASSAADIAPTRH